MGSNSKSRVVLQFNEMDFRHRRALDILRQRPRSMSELVVNAILHYTSCPVAAKLVGRFWAACVVQDRQGCRSRYGHKWRTPSCITTHVPKVGESNAGG